MFSNNELIEHGPYNELVRSLFENPLHAKDIPEKLGKPYKVVAQESKNGSKIVLTAVIKEENILALRFRVFGCPFLIAAAEFCCNQCEGKHNKEVENIDILHLIQILEVPTEKIGVILLLQDALESLKLALDNEKN
jgi:NifU-like protein involved in Fe-S cluster formation|tara:strand:- start:1319 stop:1726 length:408 start_codon:yes stop_codon:yes gene_type:complete